MMHIASGRKESSALKDQQKEQCGEEGWVAASKVYCAS